MLIEFAIKNILTRRRKTSVSIAGIAISMALLVSVILVLKSTQNSFAKPLDAIGADIVIELQGEPCSWSIVKLPQNLNPIPVESVDKLKTIPGVSEAEGSLVVWAFSEPPDSGVPQSMNSSMPNHQEIMQGIQSGQLKGEPCDYGPPGSFCGTNEPAGPGMTKPFNYKPTVVAGINTEIKNIGPINANNISTLEGRFFTKEDSFAAILDKDFARIRSLKPGARFDLGQRVFEVIGIVDPGKDAKIAGAQAYIPFKTAVELANRGNVFDMVFVKLRPGQDPSFYKEKIKTIVHPNATITSSDDFMQAIAGVSVIMQGLMLAVFVIILIISILFIIKTAFASILERSSEIGILKAVGWKDNDIIKMVLAENSILGLAGGAIGALAGYAISFLYKTNLPSLLPYYLNPYPPCSQHLAKNALRASIPLSANIFLSAILLGLAIQILSVYIASKKLLKLAPVDAIKKL